MLTIGTEVSWIGHANETVENRYRIIGNANTPAPRKDASPFNQPIPVQQGADYIIELLAGTGKLEAFQHVPASAITVL